MLRCEEGEERSRARLEKQCAGDNGSKKQSGAREVVSLCAPPDSATAQVDAPHPHLSAPRSVRRACARCRRATRVRRFVPPQPVDPPDRAVAMPPAAAPRSSTYAEDIVKLTHLGRESYAVVTVSGSTPNRLRVGSRLPRTFDRHPQRGNDSQWMGRGGQGLGRAADGARPSGMRSAGGGMGTRTPTSARPRPGAPWGVSLDYCSCAGTIFDYHDHRRRGARRSVAPHADLSPRLTALLGRRASTRSCRRGRAARNRLRPRTPVPCSRALGRRG